MAAALVESGFFSEKAVTQIERAAGGTPTGTVVYAAVATDRPSPQRGRFGKAARA